MKNYIYGTYDPSYIKDVLDHMKVKCIFDPKTRSITIGDRDEILIKDLFYEHDFVGIWWELDLFYNEQDYYEVVVTSMDTIDNLVKQAEVLIDEALTEQQEHDILDMIDEMKENKDKE